MRTGAAAVVAMLMLAGCEAADTPSTAADEPITTSAPAEDPTEEPTERDRDKPKPDKPEPDDNDPPPKPPKPPKPLKRTPAGVPRGAQLAVVDRIVDGDTLELHARRAGQVLRSTGVTDVRLLEIDTPETVHPTEPVQCYGPAASQALARLAPAGSTVWVLPDLELQDQYDRSLLYLWSVRNGKGLFVNRALVARGFAKASLYEPNDLYIDQMYAAEAQARRTDKGLWGYCPRFGAPLNTPEPPAADPPSGGGGGNCDPNYSGACIPPYPPDLDCTEIDAQGFRSTGSDPHGFDADGDGIACDT